VEEAKNEVDLQSCRFAHTQKRQTSCFVGEKASMACLQLLLETITLLTKDPNLVERMFFT